jgi:hypothetical protein
MCDRFQEPDPTPDYRLTECDNCDREIDADDMVICSYCGQWGCEKCMLEDPDNYEWYCDSSSNGKLEDSECYKKNREDMML